MPRLVPVNVTEQHRLRSGREQAACRELVIEARHGHTVLGDAAEHRAEDETGVIQVICWKSIREKQRKELMSSRLLEVHGTWQSQGERGGIPGRALRRVVRRRDGLIHLAHAAIVHSDRDLHCLRQREFAVLPRIAQGEGLTHQSAASCGPRLAKRLR